MQIIPIRSILRATTKKSKQNSTVLNLIVKYIINLYGHHNSPKKIKANQRNKMIRVNIRTTNIFVQTQNNLIKRQH